jgi:hypothetical protein
MRTSVVRRGAVAGVLLGVVVFASACASESPEAVDESSEDFSLTPVDDLKNQVRDLLNNYTAARYTDVIARKDAQGWLRAQVQRARMTPEQAIFVLRPQHSPLIAGVPFDHTEIDVVEVRQGNHRAAMEGRLLGDAWGAGLYRGHAHLPNVRDMGPPLCVTWEELNRALTTSYRPGVYSWDFVCHNVSFQVLDTLGVSVLDYASQTRGWRLASYAYGPIFAHTPTAHASVSEPAQRCVRMGIR